MRKRNSKRASSTDQAQPKAIGLFDESLEVISIERNGVMVSIEFRTTADAMNAYNTMRTSMEVDQELEDYNENMAGVHRTLKIRK